MLLLLLRRLFPGDQIFRYEHVTHFGQAGERGLQMTRFGRIVHIVQNQQGLFIHQQAAHGSFPAG